MGRVVFLILARTSLPSALEKLERLRGVNQSQFYTVIKNKRHLFKHKGIAAQETQIQVVTKMLFH